MTPVWICPLRLRGDRTWPLYPLKPGEVYVNFGFWGMASLPPGQGDGYYNRRIEDEVSALGGHKSLYSTSFYTEDEFRRRYNGEAYDKLKARVRRRRAVCSASTTSACAAADHAPGPMAARCLLDAPGRFTTRPLTMTGAGERNGHGAG